MHAGMNTDCNQSPTEAKSARDLPPGKRNMKNLLLCGGLFWLFLSGAGVAQDEPFRMARLEAAVPGQAVAPAWRALDPDKLQLRSAAALVVDRHGNEIYARQADTALPIASITKLMTAMVVLDASLPLEERIRITRDDRDLIQLTGSRLKAGATLTREQLLRLALMASENRAANALARTWPGGRTAFVRAMNRKAGQLGMQHSHFTDPAGLDPGNVASPRDMAQMVQAALEYPLIRAATTTRSISVHPYKGRGELRFNNTNRLLKNASWSIQLSKTGYLNEAGRCLVMQAEIAHQPLVIILLNSFGKLTPFGDSNRIRKWIESGIEG
jgi:D-alanyl-D-alanine endopeptidase (penicillin-binding protein 7)